MWQDPNLVLVDPDFHRTPHYNTLCPALCRREEHLEDQGKPQSITSILKLIIFPVQLLPDVLVGRYEPQHMSNQ